MHYFDIIEYWADQVACASPVTHEYTMHPTASRGHNPSSVYLSPQRLELVG